MVATSYEAEPALRYVPMSYEEWRALPEDGPRTEWVDGTAVVMPSARRGHQLAARRLAMAWERDLPGLAIDEAVTLVLPRNRRRIPDVAAFPAEPDEDLQEWQIDTRPVVVAEVLSPSTRREDLVRKSPEYAEAAVRQYWVVDREARVIQVYENVDGGWESLAVIDDDHASADVMVDQYGTVHVVLAEILDR